MRVHFICNGNAYRSRLAEGYFRSLNTNTEVTSSGVLANAHREHNDPMVIGFTDDFLRRQGIVVELSSHPVQLTQDMLSEDDVTIVINDIVRHNAEEAGITLPPNTLVWDITDVDEQTGEAEEVLDIDKHTARIFEKIKHNVDDLVDKLSK